MDFIYDVFGNEIYPGNIALVSKSDGLEPQIVYGIIKGKYKYTLKLIKLKTLYFSGNEQTILPQLKEKMLKDNNRKILTEYPSGRYSQYISGNYKMPAGSAWYRVRISDGVDAQGQVSVTDDDINTNIVALNNPLFNINIKGMDRVMNLVDEAITKGYLPNNYKLGKRISFKKDKVRKGNAVMYVAPSEDAV